jgi:hypothetical protein
VSKKWGTKRGSTRIDEIGIEIARVINLTLGIKSVLGQGEHQERRKEKLQNEKWGENCLN